mmetsp:Transcript_10305/g.13529  ORF Transcript_10305/g.13529 Transcript_10305/m.13529 type:complete len:162 (+) Transcript_10305:35-520(+)
MVSTILLCVAFLAALSVYELLMYQFDIISYRTCRSNVEFPQIFPLQQNEYNKQISPSTSADEHKANTGTEDESLVANDLSRSLLSGSLNVASTDVRNVTSNSSHGMKLINLGFMKTGTTTLKRFLKQSSLLEPETWYGIFYVQWISKNTRSSAQARRHMRK